MISKKGLRKAGINMSKAFDVSTSSTKAERRRNYARGLHAAGVSLKEAKKVAKKVIKHGKKERLH